MIISSAMHLGGGVVTITADTHQFDAAVARVLTSVNRLRAGFTALGAAATAAFTFRGAVTASSRLVDAAIDMERRLTLVRRTTGYTADQLAKFRSRIEDLATSLKGASVNELLDVAAMGSRLGVARDKLLDFTRDIAMVRIALGDIPAEEAATSIVRILNVFRRGSEDTIRFASALAALDIQSTATGRDILDISRRISGPAAVLGMSPQKLMALSTALKDAGVNNEVAGTAMSQVLSKMAAHAEQFAVVAGMNTQAFKRLRDSDPLAALTRFLQGFEKLRPETQFKVLEAMHIRGQRVGATLLQLTKVIDKLPGFVRTAENEWGNLNSIMKQNELQGGTTAAQLQRMWNSLTILAARIGDLMLPIVKALADSFASLAEQVKEFFGAHQGQIADFLRPAVAWAERLSQIFKQWPAFIQLAGLSLVEKFMQAFEVLRRAVVTFINRTAAQFRAAFHNAVVDILQLMPKNIQVMLGADQMVKVGPEAFPRMQWGDIFKNLPNFEQHGPGGPLGNAGKAALREQLQAGAKADAARKKEGGVNANASPPAAKAKTNREKLVDFMMERGIEKGDVFGAAKLADIRAQALAGRGGFTLADVKRYEQSDVEQRKLYEKEAEKLGELSAGRALDVRKRAWDRHMAPILRDRARKQLVDETAGRALGSALGGMFGAGLMPSLNLLATRIQGAGKRIGHAAEKPRGRGAAGGAGAAKDEEILKALTAANKKAKSPRAEVMSLEEFGQKVALGGFNKEEKVQEDMLNTEEQSLENLKTIVRLLNMGVLPQAAGLAGN